MDTTSFWIYFISGFIFSWKFARFSLAAPISGINDQSLGIWQQKIVRDCDFTGQSKYIKLECDNLDTPELSYTILKTHAFYGYLPRRQCNSVKELTENITKCTTPVSPRLADWYTEILEDGIYQEQHKVEVRNGIKLQNCERNLANNVFWADYLCVAEHHVVTLSPNTGREYVEQKFLISSLNYPWYSYPAYSKITCAVQVMPRGEYEMKIDVIDLHLDSDGKCLDKIVWEPNDSAGYGKKVICGHNYEDEYKFYASRFKLTAVSGETVFDENRGFILQVEVYARAQVKVSMNCKEPLYVTTTTAQSTTRTTHRTTPSTTESTTLSTATTARQTTPSTKAQIATTTGQRTTPSTTAQSTATSAQQAQSTTTAAQRTTPTTAQSTTTTAQRTTPSTTTQSTTTAQQTTLSTTAPRTTTTAQQTTTSTTAQSTTTTAQQTTSSTTAQSTTTTAQRTTPSTTAPRTTTTTPQLTTPSTTAPSMTTTPQQTTPSATAQSTTTTAQQTTPSTTAKHTTPSTTAQQNTPSTTAQSMTTTAKQTTPSTTVQQTSPSTPAQQTTPSPTAQRTTTTPQQTTSSTTGQSTTTAQQNTPSTTGQSPATTAQQTTPSTTGQSTTTKAQQTTPSTTGQSTTTALRMKTTRPRGTTYSVLETTTQTGEYTTAQKTTASSKVATMSTTESSPKSGGHRVSTPPTIAEPTWTTVKVIGVAVGGGAAVLIVLVILIVCCRQRAKHNKEKKYKTTMAPSKDYFDKTGSVSSSNVYSVPVSYQNAAFDETIYETIPDVAGSEKNNIYDSPYLETFKRKKKENNSGKVPVYTLNESKEKDCQQIGTKGNEYEKPEVSGMKPQEAYQDLNKRTKPLGVVNQSYVKPSSVHLDVDESGHPLPDYDNLTENVDDNRRGDGNNQPNNYLELTDDSPNPYDYAYSHSKRL